MTDEERADVCLTEVITLLGGSPYPNTAARERIRSHLRDVRAAEREHLCRALTDVIAACDADLATGHVPSAYCPDTRRRECQMLLAILREGPPT